jgi:hypothetical protein
LPGMDELKSAGLLRKGQILGEFGEVGNEQSAVDEGDAVLDEADLLSTDFGEQFSSEFETGNEDT